MTTTDVRTLTAADLMALYAGGVRGELVQGTLRRTMPAGGEHGEIVVNLASALRYFVKPRRLGRLAASDVGVLLERSPDTVREPDIAFFSADKIPPNVRVRGYYEAVPDLVVEVVSPNDSPLEVDDKARMWLRHGVRSVWVVRPDARSVSLLSQNAPTTILTAGDTLDGGDVLPGFACKVSDIFDTA